MQFCSKRSWAVVVGVLLVVSLAPVSRAQDHVVATQELHQAASRAAAARSSDEATIRQVLSSEAGQKALKSAHIEYQQVDKAISQLSDEDAASMAARSREVQKDFAAGHLTDRDLLIILLVAAGIILIAVAVR